MSQKSNRAGIDHAFYLKVDDKHIPLWTKARYATKEVTLQLTADHVRKSMSLGGVGNTQTCSMAVCAKSQAYAFPHPVEGYVDWTYRRAYVVTKISKKTGMPTHCVVYSHDSKIAHLNDSQGGQEALLKMIEENGGVIEITLKPINSRVGERVGQRVGERVGQRKKDREAPPRHPARRHLGVGAKRRFAVAQLGGIPKK
jgi:hypothetical protein